MNLSREEILDLYRQLPGSDPDMTRDTASTEIKAEAEAADFDADLNVCWSRSSNVMPRVRIDTGLEEYMLPWYAITQVVTKPGRHVIEIYTSLGQVFQILSSMTKLDSLYANLQMERVREIHPAQDVSVSLIQQQEPEQSGEDSF